MTFPDYSLGGIWIDKSGRSILVSEYPQVVFIGKDIESGKSVAYTETGVPTTEDESYKLMQMDRKANQQYQLGAHKLTHPLMRIEYDTESDIIVIDGQKISGAVFRTLARECDSGTWYRLTRVGGTLQVERFESDQA